jgi:hypothetical protein
MPGNILCAYVCLCVSARSYACAYVRIIFLLNPCPRNSRVLYLQKQLSTYINLNTFKNHKYNVLLQYIAPYLFLNLYSLTYSRNLLQKIRFGRKYIIFQNFWNVYKLSKAYGSYTQPDKTYAFHLSACTISISQRRSLNSACLLSSN